MFLLIDEVLARIKDEIGPLTGKRIFLRGDDGLWDLLLPEAQRIGGYVMIYPLSSHTLKEARKRFTYLVAKGEIPGIIA